MGVFHGQSRALFSNIGPSGKLSSSAFVDEGRVINRVFAFFVRVPVGLVSGEGPEPTDQDEKCFWTV